MRVAVIALSDFQAFPTGGILTFLRRFVEAAGAMKDVQVALVGWRYQAEHEHPASGTFGGYDGHKFFPVGYGRLHGVLPDRMRFFMGRSRWSRVLDEVGEVDAYYCHSPEAVLRVRELGCGAPIAVHIHGAINTVGRSRFILGRARLVAAAYETLVLRPALRASRAVFATVSDSEFRVLQRGGLVGEDSYCIRVPAMVNSPMSSPPHRHASGVLRLICVGRLEAIKGVDFVLQVVAELSARGVLCELMIIGDGTGRHGLRRQAERLGIQHQVRFSGTLGEQDVWLALAEADVFVSGSHQEGFSLALLEALAQGLPAVVTDVGSARDVVQNGVTGYVITSRDAGMFAERVLAAAENAVFMRARCVKAAEPYSSGVVSTTIVDALARIANGPGPEFEVNALPASRGGVPEVTSMSRRGPG
jgi:glycosyltransferase involved in cell wall biosynthesis